MEKLCNLLTPLKDKEMTEYLTLIFKPFNMFDPKAILVGILSIITTILTHVEYFSINYLGISVKFSAMILVLLFVDHITGTIAVIKKNDPDDPITSKKGRRLIYKGGAYIFFIYVGFMLQDEIGTGDTLFIEVLKYFHPFLLIHITFWELISIDENLKKLGVNFGVTDLLKSTYTGLKGIFKRKANNND